MLPNNRKQEKQHRKHKRELEITIALESIRDIITKNPKLVDQTLNILEFGSGDGFQIFYLQKLGNLIASDIYMSSDIKKMNGVNFTKCSITDTPFWDQQFNLIFSSQVIEHIEKLNKAFRELKRIGSDNCLYAFTVPTNIWLLLSLPAQYYNKLRVAFIKIGRIKNKSISKKSDHIKHSKSTEINITSKRKNLYQKIIFVLFSVGHGVKQNFYDCYRSFKMKNWKKLFSKNGFTILKIQPLLLSGASEWPLIPTTTLLNKIGICSSVLFLMKKTK